MIIANGYIRYVFAGNDGGLDAATGYPIAGTTTVSDAVPCQFYANNLNYLSKENGEAVTRQIYTVLLDKNDGEPQSNRIRLFTADMTEVGDFPVISSTPLDAVCQYKLTV